MNIILSRKGFDSSAGGVPSPIFPDGSMYSFPISGAGAQCSYADIRKGDIRFGTNMGTVVESLTRGRIPSDALCHFDPDLDAGAMDRTEGWKPSLGQVNAAQGLLAKHDVRVDDVFLFFGWFRCVEHTPAKGWHYVPGAPHRHVIFGWLTIAEMIDVPPDARSRAKLLDRYHWLCTHPHLHFGPKDSTGTNRIYIGDPATSGEFSAFSPNRVLTVPGETRSKWQLPAWLATPIGEPVLDLHQATVRWSMEADHVRYQRIGQWQELVLNCADRPQAAEWLTSMGVNTFHRAMCG